MSFYRKEGWIVVSHRGLFAFCGPIRSVSELEKDSPGSEKVTRTKRKNRDKSRTWEGLNWGPET